MDSGNVGSTETRSEAEFWPLPVGAVCPECTYDLRGSTSARCSECGFELAILRTPESQIPWSHRRELGRFRAYWQTVWLVVRWPKRLCIELARPVSYADSQKFRWVTFLYAYATVLVGSALWVVFDRFHGWSGGEVMWWILGGIQLWALPLFAVLPGFASNCFHPRRLPVEQQNRAIALSYYAWAPTAMTPVALFPYAIGLSMWTTQDPSGTNINCCFGGVIYFLALLLCDGRLHRLTKSVLEGRAAASILRLLLFELLAVALAISLLALPLTVISAAVVWYSLR